MLLIKEIEDNVKVKVCTKCKRELTLDNFTKEKHGKYGVASQCKDCINKKYHERKIEKGIIIIPCKVIKICSKCKKKLSLDNFYKNCGNKDGLATLCKECNSEQGKKYFKENKDKVDIRNKKYYEENKDKVLKYNEENKNKIAIRAKKYHEENKDKTAIFWKKYYEENKDKIAITMKKYRIENKDKMRISVQNRRARKNLLPSTLTLEQWEATKQYFNNRCCYCNEEKPLAQEHVIPVAKGGSYSQENIVPACQSCNSSKGTKSFHSWYKLYKSYSKEREDKILEYLEINKNKKVINI